MSIRADTWGSAAVQKRGVNRKVTVEETHRIPAGLYRSYSVSDSRDAGWQGCGREGVFFSSQTVIVCLSYLPHES